MVGMGWKQLPVDDEIPPPNGTEPTVFVPEVAKQHDAFACAITFSVFPGALALVYDWIK